MTKKERDQLRLIDEDTGALWVLIDMLVSGPRRIDFKVRTEAADILRRELARLRSEREAIVNKRTAEKAAP